MSLDIAGPPLVEARGLAVSDGSRRILFDVDLALHAGEIVTIVGPNGAGKTTLVSLVAGLRRPDGGTVQVSGHDPGRDPAARAALGLCPQELSLYDDLDADANLAFFGGLYGLRGPNGTVSGYSLANQRTKSAPPR